VSQFGFSENTFYVRKPGGTLLSANNAPASAGESAEVVSNATHLADESGQVWACDGLRSGRFKPTDNAATGAVAVLEHMRRIKCFSIRTRPWSTGGISSSSSADGGPYKLRIRVGGAVSVAGTASFVVIVGTDRPPDTGLAYAFMTGGVSPGANATKGSTTSTTEAWDSAWSTPLASNLLSVGPSVLGSARRTYTTRDYDGNTVSVEVYTLVVDIFGYTATNGARPRLYGAYCAEFVG
jgi:hypothetical protein